MRDRLTQSARPDLTLEQPQATSQDLAGQTHTDLDATEDLNRLLVRLRKGDQSAVHELMSRYQLPIRERLDRFAARLRAASPDFTVHDLWSTLSRRMLELTAKGGVPEQLDADQLLAYMTAIARHRVIDAERRAALARAARIDRARDLGAAATPNRDEFDTTILKGVDARCREILGLRARGLTYERIAMSLGVRSDAIRMRLRRAMQG